MAYADRNIGGSRIVAVVIVALIVAGMGYAFVTGLAYQFVKKKVEDLNAFDVKDPPPPPEEKPPPPPPDTPVPPPPVYSPPAIVQTPQVVQPTVITQNVVSTPDPRPEPKVEPRPEPPKPAGPPAVAKALVPKGQGSWVTNDDYPPAALRGEQQGTTRFTLSVDPSGRVTNCTITGSSGSALLDNTACNLLKRRARFGPAEDASGNKIPATYSNRFRWEIPKD